MRIIKQSSQFKHDIKREKKGKYSKILEEILMPVLISLASDEVLPQNLCDHALIGSKKGFRDCHIKPDLVLIYQKKNDNTLHLVRLGSHSELSL